MTTSNFNFVSLREAISLDTYGSGCSRIKTDDDDLVSCDVEQILGVVSDYVDASEEIGSYLQTQAVSADEMLDFFTVYMPYMMKVDDFEAETEDDGGYRSDISYDVFCVRRLEFREIVAVALVRHEVGLSHIDIYADGMDCYDFCCDEDILRFDEYLSALIEFIWFIFERALAVHRPEDHPSVVFDFRDSEIYRCITNRDDFVIPDHFRDVGVALCCEEKLKW